MEQAVIDAVKTKGGYKVVDWENVLYIEDLSDEYLSEFPYFFLEGDGYDDQLTIVKNMTIEMEGNTANIHISQRTIFIGDIIPEEEFDELLGLMRQAGSRLADIIRAEQYEKEHIISYAI